MFDNGIMDDWDKSLALSSQMSAANRRIDSFPFLYGYFNQTNPTIANGQVHAKRKCAEKFISFRKVSFEDGARFLDSCVARNTKGYNSLLFLDSLRSLGMTGV